MTTRVDGQDATLRLPDLIADRLDVLFCGTNPALSAAKAGHHFSNRSNRFWKVLHMAGFTPHQIRPEDDSSILEYRCGLTVAVERPTVRASDLTRHEFHDAADELGRKIRLYHPRFLALLGKPAFTALFHRSSADWGHQPMTFGGAQVWVLPNPSGLNRMFPLPALVAAYRKLRVATQQLPERR